MACDVYTVKNCCGEFVETIRVPESVNPSHLDYKIDALDYADLVGHADLLRSMMLLQVGSLVPRFRLARAITLISNWSLVVFVPLGTVVTMLLALPIILTRRVT